MGETTFAPDLGLEVGDLLRASASWFWALSWLIRLADLVGVAAVLGVVRVCFAASQADPGRPRGCSPPGQGLEVGGPAVASSWPFLTVSPTATSTFVTG